MVRICHPPEREGRESTGRSFRYRTLNEVKDALRQHMKAFTIDKYGGQTSPCTQETASGSGRQDTLPPGAARHVLSLLLSGQYGGPDE
jgi:hypothetical protein